MLKSPSSSSPSEARGTGFSCVAGGVGSGKLCAAAGARLDSCHFYSKEPAAAASRRRTTGDEGWSQAIFAMVVVAGRCWGAAISSPYLQPKRGRDPVSVTNYLGGAAGAGDAHPPRGGHGPVHAGARTCWILATAFASSDPSRPLALFCKSPSPSQRSDVHVVSFLNVSQCSILSRIITWHHHMASPGSRQSRRPASPRAERLGS